MAWLVVVMAVACFRSREEEWFSWSRSRHFVWDDGQMRELQIKDGRDDG